MKKDSDNYAVSQYQDMIILDTILKTTFSKYTILKDKIGRAIFAIEYLRKDFCCKCTHLLAQNELSQLC